MARPPELRIRFWMEVFPRSERVLWHAEACRGEAVEFGAVGGSEMEAVMTLARLLHGEVPR